MATTLIKRCIDDCHQGRLFPRGRSDLGDGASGSAVRVCRLRPRAQRRVTKIRDWLAERDIILAGRYSEWEYYNSDHAFIAGKKAAEKVRQLQQEKVVRQLVPRPWQLNRESAQGD